MIVRIASPNEGKNPTPNVRGLVLWIPGTVGNDKAGFDITVKTASSQTQLLQWLTIHGRNNSQVTVNCEQSDHQ